MTLEELFLNAIWKSYNELLKDGRVHYSKSKRTNDQELFSSITENSSMKGLFQALQKANRKTYVDKHLGIAFKLGIMMKVTQLAQEETKTVKVKINGQD